MIHEGPADALAAEIPVDHQTGNHDERIRFKIHPDRRVQPADWSSRVIRNEELLIGARENLGQPFSHGGRCHVVPELRGQIGNRFGI